MTIYLFQYNNYYNRQVKGNRRIEEYPQPVDSFYELQFNSNDGINTDIILNTDVGADSDYCIVCNDDNTINSRWFVMEAKRTRNSQYLFSLYRDLVYDYKDEILNAPCFIEKATLDPTNPLIFNNENFSVNQIKTKEYLLKDSFALPWIVAYVKKEASGTLNVPNPTLIADITVENLDQYEFYGIRNNIKSNIRDEQFYFQFYETWYGDVRVSNTYVVSWDDNGEPKDPRFTDKDTNFKVPLPFGSIKRKGDAYGNLELGFKCTDTTASDKGPDIIRNIQAQSLSVPWENYDLSDYLFESDPSYIYDSDYIWDQDNKILFESTKGEYYRIKVKNRGPDSKLVSVNYDSALGYKFREMANRADYLDGSEYRAPIGYVSATYSKYELSLEPLPDNALSLNISPSRPHTNNAPYDILAIPVGNYQVQQIVEGGYANKGQNTSSATAFALAAAMSSTFSSNLLDMQLLPYAPINSNFILSTKNLRLEDSEAQNYAVLRGASDEVWATLFFVQEEDFTCKLLTDDPNPHYNDDNMLIELMPFEIPAARTAEDVKVQNECKAYRIVSPNYASIFNINAAKNGGLKNLRADCTYKPFNPYIRIYPEFNLLYGSEFGDNRGMIISGDFSLPRTENAWIEYQLQNKNYLNIFDRRIENLEFNNRLDMQEARRGAVVGAIGSGVQTGTAVGFTTGNVWAGLGTGAAATAVSAGAGYYDIEILKQRQAETLDFTKDQFGYQLGNIKARPDAVAKISAFDINSKTWPFVEVYECTPEEEQAFRNKLRWNGMTVGVIGSIEAFLRTEETYIKGSLIRLSDLGVDYHMAVELASEINKGVFI